MPAEFSNAFLSFPSRQTLFEQVSAAVSKQIECGRWKPGQMLPNEVELAEMFNVSQGTMRRALKILADSGVLVRHQGKGTFVAEFSRNENLVYDRFIRLVPDQPGTDESMPTKSALYFFETVVPEENVLKALQLPPGTAVIHAARSLGTAQGLVTYDELWANAEVFKKLTKENLEHHEEKMLYAFYQNCCGVTITRCEETLKARLLSEALRRRFGLSGQIPVIEIRRIGYGYGDKPVEYHIQQSITERYHYKVRG